MTKAKLRQVRLRERKLGREVALGLAWSDGLIEIDPRLSDRRRLTVLVHEALHIADDQMSEYKVERISAFIARILWADGYRRVNEK